MASKRKYALAFNSPISQPVIRLDPAFLVSPKDYSKISPNALGRGATASVYKGSFNGKVVAIKKYLCDETNEDYKNLLKKEAADLSKLNHPNVITFFGVCLENASLILEYASFTITVNDLPREIHSLRQLLEYGKEDLLESLKLEALFQINEGLVYLHGLKICHGDLKSANVLIVSPSDEELLFKLCDMGTAQTIKTKLMTQKSANQSWKGTICFEAPEVLTNGGKKTLKSDVFSFGVVMHELLHPLLDHPWAVDFSAGNQETISLQIMQAVQKGRRPQVGNVPYESASFVALMRKCWSQDVETRPSSSELRNHVLQLQKELEIRENAGFNSPQHASQSSSFFKSPLKVAMQEQLLRERESQVKRRLLYDEDSVSSTFQKSAGPPVLRGTVLHQAIIASGQTAEDLTMHTVDRQSSFLSRNSLHRTSSSSINNIGRPLSHYLPQISNEQLSTNNNSRTVFQHHPSNRSELLAINQNTRCSNFSLDLNDNQIVENCIALPVIRTLDVKSLEMKWTGYASSHFNVNKLKPFQKEALLALEEGKDVLVLQATSSGKSACFQIAALQLSAPDYGLVLVPTLALGHDHHDNFKQMGCSSVFLNAKSSQEDYARALDSAAPDDVKSKVIICKPETLFGSESFKGILERIDPARLKFVAIDEAHLIFEWGKFRSSFNEIHSLKSRFTCPILALTATLKPSNLHSMAQNILRIPAVLKGTTDRPNVTIILSSYSLPANNAAANGGEKENKWDRTALQIQGIVKSEPAIVYCMYTEDCSQLSSCLLHLGVSSASYTGKDTNDDKREIQNNMKSKGIQVLIATKAFGMGINLPNIRYIISVGLPENLSLWVQEFGRGGRDGQPSFGVLLVNEQEEVKKLQFLTAKLRKDEERDAVKTDFLLMWQYYCSPFIGECLRKFQLNYFEDNVEDAPARNPDQCCSGCQVRMKFVHERNPVLKSLLQAMVCIRGKGMLRIYEQSLVTWMTGKYEEKRDQWITSYFNPITLKSEPSYGSLGSSVMAGNQAKLLIKGLLRQCLAKQLITLDICPSQGSSYLTKSWAITDTGCLVAEGKLPIPIFPRSADVANFLICRQEATTEQQIVDGKKTRARPKKGDDLPSQAIKLMKNEKEWIRLENNDQYILLGYHHNTTKLLFVEDITKLSTYPTQGHQPDYLWEDIDLAKRSSFEKKVIEINAESFILWRSQCHGVKRCDGLSEDNSKCKHVVANAKNSNKCLYHPNGLLKKTGVCSGYFIYISPKDKDALATSSTDNRRWLGFLAPGGNDQKITEHNHPAPFLHKIPTMVREDVRVAVEKNPMTTGNDLSKGQGGIGYNPSCVSSTAADPRAMDHLAGRYKLDTRGNLARIIIKNFDSETKKSIDQQDELKATDKVKYKEFLGQVTPYMRSCEFGGECDYAVFATPQMLRIFSEALFIEVDVTFPGSASFPYLLNVVTFNYEMNQFQTVTRVLMSKLTTSAYKKAFQKIFQLVDEFHPEFGGGKNVIAWILDFSLPQLDGLSSVIKQTDVRQKIRGCEVHYKRNVKKIAEKICRDKPSQKVFKKIAYSIPDLPTAEDVIVAFDILCGESYFLEESIQDFLTTTVRLTQDELTVDTQGWDRATSWVKWWSKNKVLRMFSKPVSEMTDADWNICPKTTNAVESQNKLSQVKSNHLMAMLGNYYRTDRNWVYRNQAAEEGIGIGLSQDQRKVQNKKRKKSRKSKNRRNIQMVEDDHRLDSDDGEINGETSSQEIDPYIGQFVWIETIGPGGQYCGWLQAKIKRKEKSGDYVVEYSNYKGKYARVKDLLDDTEVKFASPIEQLSEELVEED